MREPLDEQVSHLEDESRMLLLGIQALFGFQLIAVFSNGFASLPLSLRETHLAALLLVVLAALLVMTPAAYHRQRHPTRVTRDFAILATRIISVALAPLALGISLDVLVISDVILGGLAAAAPVGAAVLGFAGWWWYLFPRLRRHAG